MDDGSTVRLPKIESRLLLALMGREVLTHEIAMEAAWSDPDLMPNAWAEGLSVNMTRLRKKLRRGGWTVVSVFGIGWRLERVGSALDRRHQKAYGFKRRNQKAA